MNWVDLLILGVAALSALFGFVRGLVREVLGVGAWIGAALVALFAFDPVSTEVRSFITSPAVADAASVAGVFLLTLITLSLFASWAGSAVRHSALGGLDRTLGLAFGLARAAIIVIVAYIGIGLVEVPTAWPPPVLEARGLPYAYAAATWAVHLLPPRYRPRVAAPPATVPSVHASLSEDEPATISPAKTTPDPEQP